MQVSSPDDTVTHAILGGGEARQFGISDDPAFFQILSSTLYTNQPLAVVRETLCNAWDEHIGMGKTDVPIEISFDEDNNLIIRDFGPGIADADMGPIYGVYGASTKKSLKFQTGGFGLGCKAPFSYSEHFEVTSFHNGTKTIYNLARSSGEVQGKPGIFNIASFPPEETGLRVSIPIKKEDIAQFRLLIKQVVREGEILANLDGQELPRLPFSEAKSGLLFTQSVLPATFCIRYGNVIYPLPEHDSLKGVRDKARELHKQLSHCQNPYRVSNTFGLVFQAPADSISVTPSREALSVTEQTLATLNKIIPAAIENFLAEEEEHKQKLHAEWVQSLSSKSDSELIENRYFFLDNLGNTDRISTITNVADFVRVRGHTHWVSSNEKRMCGGDYKHRLREMQRRPAFNTEFVRDLRFLLARQAKICSPGHAMAYVLHKHSIHPLTQALSKANLPTRNLYLVSRPWGMQITRAAEVKELIRSEAVLLSRKMVVLGYSQEDVVTRLRGFMDEKHEAHGVLFYRVARSYKSLNKVREVIKAAGMQLLDMTIAQPWESADVVEPMRATVTSRKLDGLPVLAETARESGWTIRLPGSYDENYETINHLTDPKFVITGSRGKTIPSLEGFDRDVTPVIVKLFGENTGVAMSTTQKEAYIKKGAKCLTEHINEFVLAQYKSNRRIRAHLSRDYTRLNTAWSSGLWPLLEKIPELRRAAHLSTTLTEEDWQMVRLGRAARYLAARTSSPGGPESMYHLQFEAFLSKIPMNKQLEDLVRKIESLRTEQLINQYDVDDLYKKPDHRARVINTLRAFLKG